MSLILPGSTSGQVTVDVPAVAGNTSVVLPNTSGKLAIDGPVLIAYGNTNQSISNATFTKVVINAVSTDSNSAFDTSLYRYTPTVAGYYYVSGQLEMYCGGSAVTDSLIAIYKNGSQVIRGSLYAGGGTATEVYPNVNGIIYLNGSTDYIELWGYAVSGGGPVLYGSSVYKYLHASLIRAA